MCSAGVSRSGTGWWGLAPDREIQGIGWTENPSLTVFVSKSKSDVMNEWRVSVSVSQPGLAGVEAGETLLWSVCVVVSGKHNGTKISGII